MRLLRVLLPSVLLLGGCLPNYRWSPYAEIQYRDEGFEPEGGASHYSGETYTFGARAVPDLHLSELTIARLTGTGTNGADAERMGTVRADLASERTKSSALAEKVTHLESDIGIVRHERDAAVTELEAVRKELAETKVELKDAADWKVLVKELFSEWGVVGSFFVLILVLIGWSLYLKHRRKPKDETSNS